MTDGASTASPRDTTRMAWISWSYGVSLSRKPLAPASEGTVDGFVEVERGEDQYPHVGVVADDAARWRRRRPFRASARPSGPGRGGSRGPVSTADAPSAASPTTSMSATSRSRRANPSRTRCWSSTRRTLITVGSPVDRRGLVALREGAPLTSEGSPPGGIRTRRAGGHAPAAQEHPFAQADQARVPRRAPWWLRCRRDRVPGPARSACHLPPRRRLVSRPRTAWRWSAPPGPCGRRTARPRRGGQRGGRETAGRRPPHGGRRRRGRPTG